MVSIKTVTVYLKGIVYLKLAIVVHAQLWYLKT